MGQSALAERLGISQRRISFYLRYFDERVTGGTGSLMDFMVFSARAGSQACEAGEKIEAKSHLSS